MYTRHWGHVVPLYKTEVVVLRANHFRQSGWKHHRELLGQAARSPTIPNSFGGVACHFGHLHVRGHLHCSRVTKVATASKQRGQGEKVTQSPQTEETIRREHQYRIAIHENSYRRGKASRSRRSVHGHFSASSGSKADSTCGRDKYTQPYHWNNLARK